MFNKSDYILFTVITGVACYAIGYYKGKKSMYRYVKDKLTIDKDVLEELLGMKEDAE